MPSKAELKRLAEQQNLPLEVQTQMQDLFGLVSEIGAMRSALAAQNKIARGELKAKEEEIAELVREIEEALFAEERDFEHNVVRKVRVDTGEVVAERSMTSGERQLELDRMDPDKPNPLPKGPPDIEADLDRMYGKEES